MLNLKVFGDETPSVLQVTLRLKRCDGGVDVEAVDSAGKRIYCGTLVSFTKKGKIRVQPGVASELGFQLDSTGRIVLDKP